VEIIDRLEETLPGRFEPDTLMPAQYYDIMKRRHSLEGEHKLMFAVLEDAVECYLKNMNAKHRKQRILFYEAQNWMSAKNKIGLFAFETLCDALAINPEGLRRALEQRRIRRQGGSIRLSSRPRRGSAKRQQQVAGSVSAEPVSEASAAVR
jgi:hypothetical protein